MPLHFSQYPAISKTPSLIPLHCLKVMSQISGCSCNVQSSKTKNYGSERENATLGRMKILWHAIKERLEASYNNRFQTSYVYSPIKHGASSS
ncbi:hypothetical protein L2E82_02077 [Cichorium intybus]|uniref:Uncharacterized protein n=1 Tax=Cichorium intybus TaxID=13427 RepID=A0ACB9H0M9_CICIN|nr:hypothetical protein L2E82_02077 [Cichorium intybus]